MKTEGASINLRHRTVLILLMALFCLGACSSIRDARRAENFYVTSLSYHDALRWGDYETAFSHCTAAIQGDSQPDFNVLQQIRVTAIKVLPGVDQSNPDELRQRVEIKYYLSNQMVEKTLIDHQFWEWDTERRGWFLRSGLPQFKTPQ